MYKLNFPTFKGYYRMASPVPMPGFLFKDMSKHNGGVSPEQLKLMREGRERQKSEALEAERVADEKYMLELSPQQSKFCDLYCNGGPGLTGNTGRCYMEAFEVDSPHYALSAGKKLLSKAYISKRIQEMMEQTSEEVLVARKRITENLFSIMDETRESIYTDKYGLNISPAALRSVSVNAAKVLADLYGLNKSTDTKLTVEGNGNGGIVFNVIVPTESKQHED